ncbi:MAG TPA: ABC transporter transmembrane domain-containing protein [Flavisolibacter sp.]|nr:ABC transporter transmembrane domain-containing protein [Flavisolibacter sp.]
MKVIRRLLKYATPLHHYIPEYIIYTVLGILFGLINFTMLIPILNIMFGVTKTEVVQQPPDFSLSIQYFTSLFNYHFTNIIATKGQMYALAFVCVIIFSATVFSNLFRYLAVKVLIRLRLNTMERIRNELYSKLTHQSLYFYHNSKKGNILSTITNEVQEIEASLINALQSWLKDPFIVIVYFIGLFYISPQLTLFTIIFLPVSGLLIASITNKLKKISYFSVDLLGKILSHTEETLSGIRVIQSFAAENYSINRFKKINREFSKTSRSMFSRKELTSPLSELLGILVVVTIVMYGGYLLTTNQSELTGSQFIAYLALYSQIIQPLKTLSNASSNVQRGIVAGEKIFSLIDEPVRIQEKKDAVHKDVFSEKIELKNVSFRYHKQYVLNNINLTIQKGKTIALVGESGSGKSTLADLVSRFYDPTEGEILVDGIKLEDIRLNDLRSLISFVSQEAVLFNDTIFNNIAFGTENADKEEVYKAAAIANAHSFIELSDEQYNTFIGDRGMKLSGGQRQRLTIARAVFKNAPILILDEATSALDTESERLVQDAINKMMKNRTSIVIAHRLSTIRHADEIVVLQKGEIVERGTHEELLHRQGYYFRLVQMQEVR